MDLTCHVDTQLQIMRHMLSLLWLALLAASERDSEIVNWHQGPLLNMQHGKSCALLVVLFAYGLHLLFLCLTGSCLQIPADLRLLQARLPQATYDDAEGTGEQIQAHKASSS